MNNIKTIFEKIQSDYGDTASWAIWKAPCNGNLASKYNMEVDNIFDLKVNPDLLNQLNNNVVMVGMNFSSPVNKAPDFHNFHSYIDSNLDPTTIRNASKIRYAFTNTPYYGAYMTDIIKNYVDPKSKNVTLSDSEYENNFKIFRDELATLQVNNPTIISFGREVYNLLKKNLRSDEYSKLIKVTHYAHYGHGCATYEGYKAKVLSEL